MKISKLTPVKGKDATDPSPWRVSIPPALSPTGKRMQRFFSSKDAAECFCLPLREKMRTGQADIVLPRDQAQQALKVFKLLGDRPPELLYTIVNAWLLSNDAEARSIPFSEVIARFVESRSHLTEGYLKNMENYSRRFSAIAEVPICKITKDQLEEILAPLSPHSRNTCMAHLTALWNFAIKRDWATANPLERIERLPIPKKPVNTITAEEAQRLFYAALELRPEIIPTLALQLFAGIRPEAETMKIRWRDIDFSDSILTVTEEASKTNRSRHISLHPQALAWLNWHLQKNTVKPEELIAPFTETVLKNIMRAIRTKANLNPWKQDCLRHTFASASLASGWRDISNLCLELGHESQKMLHKHYHRAMKKNDAEAIFAICPPTIEGKIIRLHA